MFDFSKIGAVAETLETGVRDIDSRMEEIANRVHLTNRLLAALILLTWDTRLPIDADLLETARLLVAGDSFKLDDTRAPEQQG